jgi:hypothetical protein
MFVVPDIKMLMRGKSACNQLTNIIQKHGELTSDMVISRGNIDMVSSQNV